jgi:alpha-mannosidase
MAYGFGDGGGGPTREMLENIEVMKHFPALPQMRQSSVKNFFESIKPAAGSRMMPVWNGELYLEYHRGTYTTQARNKRANRKSEFLLHDTEFIATLASIYTDYEYPAAQLNDAWRTVCLNQFHDIIPGSSIGAVYEESQQQYAELTENVTQLRDDALRAIADKLDADVLLVNATSFTQPGLVFIPGASSEHFTLDGEPVPVQETESGLWADVGEIPPYSVLALSSMFQVPSSTPNVISHESLLLENDFLRVEFNKDGDIIHIFDKQANREVLTPGSIANQFQAFEDRPKSWDAWDIDIFYDDKLWLAEPATSINVIEYGKLRQTVNITRKFLDSEFTQRISLSRNSARLDFDTSINWQQRHIMLKVAFPVDVLSPQATYEIQWGNVQRPTHRNTSWDWARFETCAHKWVDLSEGDYGVSLLNDCKYGHDIQNSIMRITLLRSTTEPDPTADAGEHQFKYSLYPHRGSWNEETQREAYLLNDPIIVYQRTIDDRQSTLVNGLSSMVTVSAPNVIIETIKRAEDGNGIIVRLYESQRKRGRSKSKWDSQWSPHG